jgi:hypothetical protein
MAKRNTARAYDSVVRAKALPLKPEAPFKPLPPRNRPHLEVGTSRKAWDACSCGADRIEVLIAVLADGGRDWGLLPCVECEKRTK